ncbi:S-layer homology domain-containing protein [Effusibacillus pohliae]|uniref:S-layer homology domain-containing protein n=1 Tax=Effusibacillus pohliae TaxID=232270 RepID=UPI000367B246|nr:S-layer homology domain-containing protein [Effusibacillus pohliae]
MKKSGCLTQKVLKTCLTACLFLGPAASAHAIGAEDLLAKYHPVDIDNHWATEKLYDAVYADVVSGYAEADGSVKVKPNNSITRAEFVTLLVKSLGLKSDQAGKRFEDVPAGSWYAEYVRIASSLGIVSGVSDTRFEPNRLIQRDEMATLLVKAFSASVSFNGQPKPFTDVPDYWAKPYIEKASTGVVSGYPDGQFKPFAPATRAEAVAMLKNGLNMEKNAAPDDQVLTNVVLGFEQASLSTFQKKEYNRLDELNANYNTGFYHARVALGNKDIQSLVSEGYTVEATLKGQLSAHVLNKTNRFAAVELTGAIYQVTVTKGAESVTITKDSSGTVFLKKMPDEGTWKMYNVEHTNPQ